LAELANSGQDLDNFHPDLETRLVERQLELVVMSCLTLRQDIR